MHTLTCDGDDDGGDGAHGDDGDCGDGDGCDDGVHGDDGCGVHGDGDHGDGARGDDGGYPHGVILQHRHCQSGTVPPVF